MTEPDYVLCSRESWNGWAKEYFDSGRRDWAAEEPSWGIWGVPESQLGVLPNVAGKDVIELGCGTAYVSSWLARRGTRVTASTTPPPNWPPPVSLKRSSVSSSAPACHR